MNAIEVPSNSSSFPCKIGIRNGNPLVKQAKSKLIEKNKNSSLGSKDVKIGFGNDLENAKIHNPSDLCEQVKDISNQLAKLAEPDTTAKFVRNPDHRGYLMMYPEVLPVYTSSKFSSVGPLLEPSRESDGWLPVESQFENLGPAKHFDRGPMGDSDRLNKSKITQELRYSRPSSRVDSYNSDDPEKTLDELTAHLLKPLTRESRSRETVFEPVCDGPQNLSKSKSPDPASRVLAPEKISTDPSDRTLHPEESSVVRKAASVLEHVRRRRIHLENNLDAVGRAQYSQSVFEILQHLGENECSFEKARIQARIIDAIASAGQKKTTVPIRSGQSRVSRTKTNPVITGKQRVASQSPGPSPVRPFADFLGTDFEWNETDTPGSHSTSPNWHHAPWRINRTRVKRPGYPRIVNDPVPPRRATIRLGAQKSEKLNALKNPVVQRDESRQTPEAPSRRVPKTVRFRAQVQNTPERDNQTTQTIQTSRPNVTNRLRTGIIPLGRAQYSAQTLSTESLNVDQGQEYYQRVVGKQDASVHVSSSDLIPAPVMQSTRMVRQPSSTSSDLESMGKSDRSAQWIDENDDKTTGNSRALVDTALSPHMRTSSRLDSSITCPGDRLPTPETSPDVTEHSTRYSMVRTPAQSPDRSGPSRLDVGIGFSNRSTPMLDHLNRQTDAANFSESDEVSDHGIATPQSSPSATRPMVRTPASPFRTAAVVYTQTSPRHQEPPVEVTRNQYDSESSTLDPDRHSCTDSRFASEIEFSLTAPNTFSDGMWLLDRSEGEAPCQVDQKAFELIASNVNLGLPGSVSHMSASTSTWDEDKSSRERRLSDGEQTSVKPFNTSATRLGPMNNPLLELMALQGSKSFHVTNLTSRERNQVERITSDLRNAKSQAQKFDWLTTLSGLGDHVRSRSVSGVDKSSLSQCSERKISELKDSLGELTPEQPVANKVVRTDDSDSSKTPLSPGEQPLVDQEPKLTDPQNSPDLPKNSPTDTLEMVKAVDSDASTTLNDPVYEDDYVTDSSA